LLSEMAPAFTLTADFFATLRSLTFFAMSSSGAHYARSAAALRRHFGGLRSIIRAIGHCSS
jgi:hypothetical protein